MKKTHLKTLLLTVLSLSCISDGGLAGSALTPIKDGETIQGYCQN